MINFLNICVVLVQTCKGVGLAPIIMDSHVDVEEHAQQRLRALYKPASLVVPREKCDLNASPRFHSQVPHARGRNLFV